MLDSAEQLGQALGDWSSHPNKAYVGKIDRVQASSTQAWTPEYYIDHYLQSHNRPVTHWNRDVVSAALGKFKGRAPFKRWELDEFLDGTWRFAPD
ncbi:hypothetical protein LQ772_09385 [Frateuria edaphi]|jgi:hypothetical protein|uniref:hypothetical protein n=1 Tax=Frateuria TaxID=70411 RepID=UPI001E65A246|nr:hypothetical protein [Frateuria edaphi]UGB44217.1 hypothetical protein LQ772_09385 [Frateuria edaphi]